MMEKLKFKGTQNLDEIGERIFDKIDEIIDVVNELSCCVADLKSNETDIKSLK